MTIWQYDYIAFKNQAHARAVMIFTHSRTGKTSAKRQNKHRKKTVGVPYSEKTTKTFNFKILNNNSPHQRMLLRVLSTLRFHFCLSVMNMSLLLRSCFSMIPSGRNGAYLSCLDVWLACLYMITIHLKKPMWERCFRCGEKRDIPLSSHYSFRPDIAISAYHSIPIKAYLTT